MFKSIRILLLCFAMAPVLPMAAMAYTETTMSPEEELAQLLEVDESQYQLSTRGQAVLIVPGDPLLDGNYENGELVNGGIYHSVQEAIAGVKQDKIDAREICGEEKVNPPKI